MLPVPLERLLVRVSPWLFPAAAVAAMVELIGGGWDIQWHLAAIPEVFWTPPHIVLYAGAAFVLLATGGAFALRSTERRLARSFEVGAAVAFTGALLQLASGAFDNAWHAAFGADDALSPPHVMLTTAIVLTTLGIVFGLHAMRRQEEAAGARRAVTWTTHAVAVTALTWASWGWLFIVLYPGLSRQSPLVEPFGLRLFTGAAFAALTPLMALTAASLVGRRGAATLSFAVQTGAFLLIVGLMGNLGDVAWPFVPLFLIPGIAADLAYRPAKASSPYVPLALGAILGQYGFIQGGVLDAMTQPLASPVGFALAFAGGGVAGAILAMALAAKADGLARHDRVPAAAPA